jgi:hypothetical protein
MQFYVVASIHHLHSFPKGGAIANLPVVSLVSSLAQSTQKRSECLAGSHSKYGLLARRLDLVVTDVGRLGFEVGLVVRAVANGGMLAMATTTELELGGSSHIDSVSCGIVDLEVAFDNQGTAVSHA